LTIDNNGHNGNYAGVIEEDVASLGDYSILMENYGHLRAAGTGSSFAVDNDTFSGDDSAVMAVEGTLSGPSDFLVDGITLRIEGVLEDVQDLTVGGNGGMILRAHTDLYSGTHFFGDLTVQSGGKIVLTPADNGNTNYGDDFPFSLQVDNLHIESGGVVTSDTSGYFNDKGPGAGISAVGGQGGSGAGYGGAGGNSTYAGGGVYGDL
jgi:hypothetical protein